MIIEEYKQEITREMMSLLLTADPSEATVLSYLDKSKIIVCKKQDQCIGIAAFTVLDDIVELKNIAVAIGFQGKGVAKLIITQVKHLAKELGAITIDVGTGNSSFDQLALYQKCGFRMSHIEKNFFKRYPKPIFENGIRCIDMVRLHAKL